MSIGRSEKWKRNKTWTSSIYSYNKRKDNRNKEEWINKILKHKYKKENWVTNPYYEKTGEEWQIVLLKSRKGVRIEKIKEKILEIVSNVKGLLDQKGKLLMCQNIGILVEWERKEILETLEKGEGEIRKIEEWQKGLLIAKEKEIIKLYEKYKEIRLEKKGEEEIKELYKELKESGIIKIEEEVWRTIYEITRKEWEKIEEEIEKNKEEKEEIERLEKKIEEEIEKIKKRRRKRRKRKKNWKKRKKSKKRKKRKKIKKSKKRKKKKKSKEVKIKRILKWIKEYIEEMGIMKIKDKEWLKRKLEKKEEVERREKEERRKIEEYIKKKIGIEVKIRMIEVKRPVLGSKMIGEWIRMRLMKKSFKRVRKDIKRMVKILGMEEKENTYDWNKIKKTLWKKSIRSYIKGIYIEIKGKINKKRKAGRSMKKILKIGEMAKNNIKSLNENTLIEIRGKNGVYSLKVGIRTIIVLNNSRKRKKINERKERKKIKERNKRKERKKIKGI